MDIKAHGYLPFYFLFVTVAGTKKVIGAMESTPEWVSCRLQKHFLILKEATS